MLTKRFKKYLDFEIHRFSNTLDVLERVYERLKEQNYTDIRDIYANVDQIKDIRTLDCDKDSVTVEFVFDVTIENSPVDDYGMLQIRELIEFVKKQLKYFENQLEHYNRQKNKTKNDSNNKSKHSG